MFENMVLRKMFGTTGSEGLNDLCLSPNVNRVAKPRRM